MEPSGDSPAQSEELIVLQSVFADEFVELPDSYSITFKVDSPNPDLSPLILKFTYPTNYPSLEHPVFTLSSKWLNDTQIQKIYQKLVSLFIPGEVVVYQWTDWLRENCVSFLGLEEQLLQQIVDKHEEDELVPIEEEEEEGGEEQNDATDPLAPKIYHGVPVTDRKSKFQAHLAVVHSVEEADMVVAELLKDKKIANATHNISAYRIIGQNGTKYENRDDDGETGAGDKLLYMLDKGHYVNLVVVVTRWFGGIMLGADRFKHINGAAKALLDLQYNNIKEESVNGFSGGKFRPSEDVYNRIKWDSEINKDDFIIGYEDRFIGDMEIPFTEFGETEIPFHRIRYYKKNGEILWDRRKKIDNFF